MLNSQIREIDVIVPVYDGFEETRACIESVLASTNRCTHHVIAINDGSPNAKLSAWLEEMAKAGKLELSVNEKNLGFVATVNKGMKLNTDRDVVLVNSDTLVANDWLDRLYSCAYERANIATVTPFSNNAEIFSFPTLCKSNELVGDYDVESLDKVFSEQVSNTSITFPTAVGFCMYIKREALDKAGYFDEEAFGRGYGEENDFCLRCTAQGMEHVMATNTFVFHEGGVSFSDEKIERVENAMRILDEKYPHYHRVVHEHIQQNPVEAIRQKVQLDLLLGNARTKLLHITHHMGGGVQFHIEELQRCFADRFDILLLRPSEEKDVELSYHFANYDFRLHFDLEDDWELLLEILRALNFKGVHFHHLMRVPEKIWPIAQILNLECDVTLHDYYFINGNPTLTDKNGVYVENLDEREEKCAEHYPLPEGMTLQQWHQKMKNFLMGAKRVYAPCQATADIYNLYFRELEIIVAYHTDAHDIEVYPDVHVPEITEKDKIRVAVIGAISREKGADVLEHTACHKDPLNRLEFHLIGYAYKPLRETVEQHGAYRNEELQDLIKKINPHIIWFPAQWPETYCYVLSSAMQSGLPIIASNLGSFPERLHGRPASYIKPWNIGPEGWKNALIEIREWMVAHSGQVFAWPNSAFGQTRWRYTEQYLPGVGSDTSARNLITLDKIEHLASGPANQALSRKEALLKLLLKLRELPPFRRLLRLVPFETQRKIKRLLSQKPIHDILNGD